MEERATDFVEAMAVIAVIGVLAFLIGWLVRMPQGQQAPTGGTAAVGQSPRWYEFALALLLLAAIAAFLIIRGAGAFSVDHALSIKAPRSQVERKR